jgi:hypothetical protein
LDYFESFKVCRGGFLKIYVSKGVGWNEVVVKMRYFITSYDCCDSSRIHPFLECRRYLLRSGKYSSIVWLWYIIELIYLYLWDDKGMPRLYWPDIKKGIYILIFIDLERWYFSSNNSGKKSRHKKMT